MGEGLGTEWGRPFVPLPTTDSEENRFEAWQPDEAQGSGGGWSGYRRNLGTGLKQGRRRSRARTNQEHGVIATRKGSGEAMPRLKVGDRLRILPNHASATAVQHERCQVIEQGSDRGLATWERFNGW